MTIRTELLDELLKEYKKPEDLMGEGGILKELTKALVSKVADSVEEERKQWQSLPLMQCIPFFI